MAAAATKKQMANPYASHHLVFLATLLCVVTTLVAYKSILSFDAAGSFIEEDSFAPPRRYAPPQRHGGITSDTDIAEDAPAPYLKDAEEQEDEYVTPPSQKEKTSKAAKKAKKATFSPKDATIRIRDFVPLPVPPNVLRESEKRKIEINFDAIATKWELPDGSIDLLKQIQSRTVGFDYNRTTDILSLRHPLKTGGTSFSLMMNSIYGERVVPGSGKSHWWQKEKFKKALEKHGPEDPYWSDMAVIYTHTFLRPFKGPAKKPLLEELREAVPAFRKKRFRLMTIVRRPLDLAASSFYETQCRIGAHAKQRRIKDEVCPPVNLTDVMHKNIDHWTEKCKTELNWKTRNCQNIKDNGGESVFGHCGSIDVLLEKGYVHNMMHKSLMGDFPRPPELGDDESIGVNLTPTLKDVSLYTLRDLGGLIDYNQINKEDFVWFSVTERFKESMCIFYYHFEVEPVAEKKSL